MARKQQSALETVKRNLGALSLDELHDLSSIVDRLIAIKEREADQEEGDPQDDGNASKAEGGGPVVGLNSKPLTAMARMPICDGVKVVR